MKLPQLPVFLRYGHALQILVIPYGLEVPAYQQQIDLVLVLFLQLRDVGVDRIQFAVTAAFNRDLEA
jgi:hypothetical protein